MNNKNSLYFALGMMGLLGVYYLLMTTVYAPKPSAKTAQVQTVQSEAQPVAPTTPATATATPAPQAAAPTGGRTIGVENADLRLVFRVEDGALTQVVWKQDHTAFLPDTQVKDGKTLSKPFPGIGGALGTRFEGDPEVTQAGDSQVVAFRNASGDRLEYRIPAKGHALDVALTTTRGAHLALLRRPTDLSEVAGLGKVFSLQGGDLASVAWMDMLKDPWTSFLGSKRKELPQAATRLGMETGIPQGRSQTTHYFVALWDVARTPERDLQVNPGFHLAPGQDGKATGRLYLGPKQKEALEAFGPEFSKVMDFGFFGVIAKAMFWVLRAMNRVIPNWGWTLVVFALLLRFALWGLNTKQTLSMLRMKDLEPHQKAIQAKYEKFGNDMTKKAEMQKELMAFYKKNGHNPMGGCLPMLLQMPVFFALWSMLQNVYELRHAPFHFWLQDLSSPDKFYILAILLGASMFVQSKLTPAMGDPAQRKMMMYMMPAMMIFFFANTPAGLCLYYLVFNLVGLFQTWYLQRTYKPQPVVL